MQDEEAIRTRLVSLKNEHEFRRDWVQENRNNPELDEADKEIFRDYVNFDKVLDNEIRVLEWVLNDEGGDVCDTKIM